MQNTSSRLADDDLERIEFWAADGQVGADDQQSLVAEVRRLRSALVADRGDTLVVHADDPRGLAESGALDWWSGNVVVTDETVEAVVDRSAADRDRLAAALREMAEHIIDGEERPGMCSPCDNLVRLARAALDQEDDR